MHSIYIPFIREPILTGLSAEDAILQARYGELLFPDIPFVIIREP